MEVQNLYRRIGIWGDSITWGCSDYEKGGWVNRLWLFLENEFEEDISAFNMGIPGDATDDIIDRFEIEYNARKPEIIIFAVGINDSVYIENKKKPRVSIQKFENNIQLLINLAKKYTNKIGFIGLTKVDESKTMPIPWSEKVYYDNEQITIYDLKLQEVVKKNNLKYLYMFNIVSSRELFDGLHPDNKGHQNMYLKIKEFILDNFILI